MRALTAVAAHDKDVNAVAVSPNDAFAVSASQDRTAKVCDELYEYTWRMTALQNGQHCVVSISPCLAKYYMSYCIQAWQIIMTTLFSLLAFGSYQRVR